jgi:hypothetical protein
MDHINDAVFQYLCLQSLRCSRSWMSDQPHEVTHRAAGNRVI